MLLGRAKKAPPYRPIRTKERHNLSLISKQILLKAQTRNPSRSIQEKHLARKRKQVEKIMKTKQIKI
jgi:hypothetical protein